MEAIDENASMAPSKLNVFAKLERKKGKPRGEWLFDEIKFSFNF